MNTYPESAVNSKMDIQKIRRGRKQIAKERNEGIKAEKGKEGKEFNKNAIYPNVKEALIEYLTFETRLCNLKERKKKKKKEEEEEARCPRNLLLERIFILRDESGKNRGVMTLFVDFSDQRLEQLIYFIRESEISQSGTPPPPPPRLLFAI